MISLRKKRRSRADNQHLSLNQSFHLLVLSRLPVMVWVELILGLISAVFVMLALFLPYWMELWLDLSPDAGSGSAEYGFALFWAALSVAMFGLAGRTWKNQIRTSSIGQAIER